MAGSITNVLGVDLVLKANGIEIGCAQSIDVDIKTATTSAVCRADGGWEQTIAGRHSWTASTSGLIRVAIGDAIATNMTYADLTALQITRTPVTLIFGTSHTGDHTLTGTALITDTKATSPLDGGATFTISFTGTGPLVQSINP